MLCLIGLGSWGACANGSTPEDTQQRVYSASAKLLADDEDEPGPEDPGPDAPAPPQRTSEEPAQEKYRPRPAECLPVMESGTLPRAVSGIRSGMIVPAYLTLPAQGDVVGADCLDYAVKLDPRRKACMWQRLRDQAAKLSPTYDFWVVANGPDSGPFEPGQWDAARAVLDPIQNAGGKIFGYVHTNVPRKQGSNYIEFRELAVVEAEIQTWVTQYSSLEGIWIDELYPRYELFGTDDAPDVPLLEEYPNSLCYTPETRDFMVKDTPTSDWRYNPAINIPYTGGYYHSLTAWIRTTYPQLKIIGNAGGALRSNQRDYANLVDVLVSYERSYDVSVRTNWADMLPQNEKASHQLGLVHSTKAATPAEELQKMKTSLEQLYSHRYGHVYVGYEEAGASTATGHPPVWGILPPFLEDEVQWILDRR